MKTDMFCVCICVGVDPFAYVTIASAAMATWKHKFLQRNEVAYFPHGVAPLLKDSIRWYEFLMATEHIHIQHVRNGGEVKCGGLQVHGYDDVNHTVYEFHDCFRDGCATCFPKRLKPREAKANKVRLLKVFGYKVVEMWSCQFQDLRYMSSSYRQFNDRVPVALNDPLDPRCGFYGGRTNAVKLHDVLDESADEQIRYLDFTSLYSAVNKYDPYPVGHPECITDPSLDRLVARAYYGMVKCTVVPPRGLFHPVLPVRCLGKLMFPLCRTCVETQTFPVCLHEGRARAFTGTWCTPEIYKAMDVGYEVLEVHEVHHFAQRRVGLFAEFVNTFLKAKQEASGWYKVRKVRFLLYMFTHTFKSETQKPRCRGTLVFCIGASVSQG